MPARQQFDLAELTVKPLLSRPEAAALLGVSQKFLDVRTGTLFPYVRVGRRVMYQRVSLLAAVAKLERRASQGTP